MASAALTALSLSRTILLVRNRYILVGASYIPVRPLRMPLSNAATKSENTASASCSPASTEMMSELGFVYLLLRTSPRKMVKVFFPSVRAQFCVRRSYYVPLSGGNTYIERVLIRRFNAFFYAAHGPEDQLLWMRLQVEEVVGGEGGEHFAERFRVGFQEEEFEPEALGFLDFVFILLRVSIRNYPLLASKWGKLGETCLEEGFVEAHYLWLKRLWPRLL
jgi:hypothetical protein